VSVQERVAKLEALLARVSKRAQAPRLPNGDGALVSASESTELPATPLTIDLPMPEAALVQPAAEPVDAPYTEEPTEAREPPEPEALHAAGPTVSHESMTPVSVDVEMLSSDVEIDEEEIPVIADGRPMEVSRPDELPSRERMVAAPPTETADPETAEKEIEPPISSETDKRLTEAAAPDPEKESLESSSPEREASEAPLAVVSELGKIEEAPASSRRPITLEPKLEELAFGEAAPSEEPHSAPPESGRQVAASPDELDFDNESTGVRSKEVEPISASPPGVSETPSSRPAESSESALAPAPLQGLEAPGAPEEPPSTLDNREPVASPPEHPAAQAPAAEEVVDARMPEVIVARAAAEGANEAPAPAAVFAGAAPVFKPLTFGELLDATLSL
jgi:hypothetical protein